MLGVLVSRLMTLRKSKRDQQLSCWLDFRFEDICLPLLPPNKPSSELFSPLYNSSCNAFTDPLPLCNRGVPQCLWCNRHIHLRHSSCRLANLLLWLCPERLIFQPWHRLRRCTRTPSMVCSFLRSSSLPAPSHISQYTICSCCKTNGVSDSSRRGGGASRYDVISSSRS